MGAKIKIVPSKLNRYEERRFSHTPIIKSRFRTFMSEMDNFILNLNKLLSINKKLFIMAYSELCMIINNDWIDFDSTPKKINELKEIAKLSYLNVYESYVNKYKDTPQKDFDILNYVYTSLLKTTDLMKHLYNLNKESVGKLRGIAMEAICLSIFGNTKELREDSFVWDFNAYENEDLIIIKEKQTADIYFKESMNCLISEIKCRPGGIDEGQVDFINYVAKVIDENCRFTPKKIILHGGTIDDYNNLKIDFRHKLVDFKVYCKNSIEKLLEELPIF